MFHGKKNVSKSLWEYIISQASDSVCDGTRTHPSSLPEMLELLFCRLNGIWGADGAGICNEAPDTGGGGMLFGGGLEFIRISSNCRLRFAWNFNNSSYKTNEEQTLNWSPQGIQWNQFRINWEYSNLYTFSINLLHSSNRSWRSLGSIFDRISSRCLVT